MLIDRRSGAPAWRLDLKGGDAVWTRHVVGSTHVAMLSGTLDKRTLELVEIRRGQGDPGKVDPPPPPPPPPAVRWQVQPDPLPASLTLPEKPEGAIPITGHPPLPNNMVDEVIFPTSSSPFVSVAVKDNGHEVWDLRTLKPIGVIRHRDPYSIGPALSPDGAFWAKPNFQLDPTKAAHVHATANNQFFEIKVSPDKSRWFDHVDFAGPGQLVTLLDFVGKGGLEVRVQVWDIKTGKELHSFTAPAHMARKQRAFSPGRRYLALVARENNRVLLYDLTSGQLAGEQPLSGGGTCLGLSFAPDSKSLAGLFKTGAVTRLLVWDLAAGKQTAEHRFDQEPVPSDTVYQGQTLEWLPDGGGWMLHGRALVDAQSGAVYWHIDPAGAHARLSRRLFGGDRLAYVKVEGVGRTLVIEPLPAEKIAEALKAARSRR